MTKRTTIKQGNGDIEMNFVLAKHNCLVVEAICSTLGSWQGNLVKKLQL